LPRYNTPECKDALLLDDALRPQVSNHELQQRSESELAALFCAASEGLVRSERGSPERRNALASLENISLARAARMTAG
jgi:hypothetical protein